MSLLWYSRVGCLSLDVPAVAGFLCNKAALLGDIIQNTHSSWNISSMVVVLNVLLRQVIQVLTLQYEGDLQMLGLLIARNMQ
jgi:hypothetical protein